MKKAFTMMELIFVIAVIGILATIISPRFSSNKLQEAATQVLAHIRYTQHLAMIDDKYDASVSDWFRENWQIEFSSAANVYYQIYSDFNHAGNANTDETAIDPLTGNILRGSVFTSTANLGKVYGIKSVTFSSSCRDAEANKELSFDYLGRPYFYVSATKPDSSDIFKYLLKDDCEISLADANDTVTIVVHPETGYAQIKQ